MSVCLSKESCGNNECERKQGKKGSFPLGAQLSLNAMKRIWHEDMWVYINIHY